MESAFDLAWKHFAELWFSAFALWIALSPRPLKFRRGRRSPDFDTVPRWRENVIRTVALVIGLTILADVIVQLAGRPPFLH